MDDAGYQPEAREAAVTEVMRDRIVDKKTRANLEKGPHENIAVVEISDLLAYLLTGEGKDFTQAVDDLLVEQAQSIVICHCTCS